MQLNDLLKLEGVDIGKVIVMRHRPTAPGLRKVLPWLATERPATFNAYQQTQEPRVEKAMLGLCGNGFLASFIGQKPGQATFVGLYKIGSSKPLTSGEFWAIPAYLELERYGSLSFSSDGSRQSIEHFDLIETDFCKQWKGKLIVNWPPPERSWWRRAERNTVPIAAILEESLFDKGMPSWEEIILTWEELSVMPVSWRNALLHWCAIYFIHDASDGRGYAGSAYGETNLLGRWLNYASSGHGGNTLLRGRDPTNFRFSILQLLAPVLPGDEVIRIENSWKDRLHTRKPHGLNEN